MFIFAKKENGKYTYVIDVDGTIFESLPKYTKNHWGSPIEGAIETINDLFDKGHKIVIFTARGEDEKKELKKLLKSVGLKFTEVQMGKPIADFYIDDRSVAFKSWKDVKEKIKGYTRKAAAEDKDSDGVVLKDGDVVGFKDGNFTNILYYHSGKYFWMTSAGMNSISVSSMAEGKEYHLLTKDDIQYDITRSEVISKTYAQNAFISKDGITYKEFDFSVILKEETTNDDIKNQVWIEKVLKQGFGVKQASIKTAAAEVRDSDGVLLEENDIVGIKDGYQKGPYFSSGSVAIYGNNRFVSKSGDATYSMGAMDFIKEFPYFTVLKKENVDYDITEHVGKLISSNMALVKDNVVYLEVDRAERTIREDTTDDEIKSYIFDLYIMEDIFGVEKKEGLDKEAEAELKDIDGVVLKEGDVIGEPTTKKMFYYAGDIFREAGRSFELQGDKFNVPFHILTKNDIYYDLTDAREGGVLANNFSIDKNGEQYYYVEGGGFEIDKDTTDDYVKHLIWMNLFAVKFGIILKAHEQASKRPIDSIEPMQNLWYENDAGDRKYPPENDGGLEFMEDCMSGEYYIQRLLMPMLVDNFTTNEGSMMRGESTINCIDEIVMYLMKARKWRLVDAVTYAGSTCSRCLNILLDNVGALKFTKEEKDSSNTWCEHCEVIDPEYDKEYKRKERIVEYMEQAGYREPLTFDNAGTLEIRHTNSDLVDLYTEQHGDKEPVDLGVLVVASKNNFLEANRQVFAARVKGFLERRADETPQSKHEIGDLINFAKPREPNVGYVGRVADIKYVPRIKEFTYELRSVAGVYFADIRESWIKEKMTPENIRYNIAEDVTQNNRPTAYLDNLHYGYRNTMTNDNVIPLTEEHTEISIQKQFYDTIYRETYKNPESQDEGMPRKASLKDISDGELIINEKGWVYIYNGVRVNHEGVEMHETIDSGGVTEDVLVGSDKRFRPLTADDIYYDLSDSGNGDVVASLDVPEVPRRISFTISWVDTDIRIKEYLMGSIDSIIRAGYRENYGEDGMPPPRKEDKGMSPGSIATNPKLNSNTVERHRRFDWINIEERNKDQQKTKRWDRETMPDQSGGGYDKNNRFNDADVTVITPTAGKEINVGAIVIVNNSEKDVLFFGSHYYPAVVTNLNPRGSIQVWGGDYHPEGEKNAYSLSPKEIHSIYNKSNWSVKDIHEEEDVLYGRVVYFFNGAALFSVDEKFSDVDLEGDLINRAEESYLGNLNGGFTPTASFKKKDKIPGGLSDKMSPSDFDKDKLEKGIKVELEHTNDKAIATEIAMDHLAEDENYYDKLEKIHSASLKQNAEVEASQKKELSLM